MTRSEAERWLGIEGCDILSEDEELTIFIPNQSEIGVEDEDIYFRIGGEFYFTAKLEDVRVIKITGGSL